MAQLKNGLFLAFISFLVIPSITHGAPSTSSPDEAAITLQGIPLNSRNSITTQHLKDDRQKQLREKGQRVVVWMGEIEVQNATGNYTKPICPLRVMTTDMLCDRPEYAEIRDPAISCRDYGDYEDCSALSGKLKRECKTRQSLRKITWVGKGPVSDKRFRIVAHDSVDPFPLTVPFEIGDIPKAIDKLCNDTSGRGDLLDGKNAKSKFKCQIKPDVNISKPGASRVVKYTIFKLKEIVGGVVFQCPPLDPYFIIRK